MTTFEKERGETFSLLITARDEQGEPINLAEGAFEVLEFFDILETLPFPFEGAGRYVRMERRTAIGGWAYQRLGGSLVLDASGNFNNGSGYVMVVSPSFTLGQWVWYIMRFDDGEATPLAGSENFTTDPEDAPDPTTLEWDATPSLVFDNATVVTVYDWQVDSWIRSVTAGRVHESMQPDITEEGKVALGYDTARLAAGDYHCDIRFTQNGRDQFTREFKLKINSTVTPYSRR